MHTSPNIFALFLNLLLYPSRVFLDSRVSVRWLLVLIVEIVVVTAGLIGLLGLWLPFSTIALVIGPIIGFAAAMMSVGFLIQLIEGFDSMLTKLVFCFARTIPTVGVPVSLGLIFLMSPRLVEGLDDIAIGLIFLILGVLIGGNFIFGLLLTSSRQEAAGLRWFAAGSAIIIGGLIWGSPPLRGTNVLLAVPTLIGFGLALLRPLSYLWAAPLSLILALAGRTHVPATRLLQVHPVHLDELVLLPLPGLTGLLVRACQQDPAQGAAWLLQVGAHPSQHWAAQRALTRLASSPEAHRVLFWLSTEPKGIVWLQQLVTNALQPHPLIAAYAALSTVEAPAAWPSVLAMHRAALITACEQPGGATILALVETGAQTLAAERWSSALIALRDQPDAPASLPEPLDHALQTMRSWSDQRLPTLLNDRATALATLWDDLATLEGWPAQLLDAMAEQLVYLLLIEHRRGAWLV